VTVVAPPARQALGIALAERADRTIDWPGLGRQAPPRFTLVLVEDSGSLARLTRGRAPGWGAAVAFPGARTIILRADLPDLDQTLRHEIGHLVLRGAVRVRMPLWFDEGYAAWGSGEFTRLASLDLNLTVATGRIPTFEELDQMLRGSATSAGLAYALAASAVAEIARRPEPGGIAPLFRRLQAGEDFDAALEASTGLSPDRFEESWQAALRHRYSLLTWLVAGGMWSVVAFLLGGLLWYRRRRDRPRRDALDQGWVVLSEQVSPIEDSGLDGRPPVDPGGLAK
jgi:Peptidase MA superfamily